MTEDKTKPDPDETADDETATGDETPSSGGSRSRATAASDDGDVTRLASDAELADLARLRSTAPRRRQAFLGVVMVLLVGFIAAAAVIALGRFESEITWPGEIDGDFNDARMLLHVDESTALLVYWPEDERNVVSGDGTNAIDVVTAVGRARNVPFHLSVTKTVLTNGLVATTAETYADWKLARQQDGWLLGFATEKLVFLNERESGYPAWSILYARNVDGTVLSGRALYMRHLDREIVVLREAPLATWGRSEKLMDGYPCIAANLDAVRARFEIPEQRVSGRPDELLAAAYTSVQNNLLSSDWRLLDRTLRTVILSAYESGNDELRTSAVTLYATFRLRVQNWYVRQCLAFLNESSDSEDAKSASARTAIRLECARRLPDESDARQRRIAQDDWSVSK